ncbi:MAG: molybdate ABC transporter substrate-binding protein [Desulforegulaceae bacterium]|nr:molybdate ABC transporter substrate-binding protein [Desulforegulaceae bacterium]
MKVLKIVLILLLIPYYGFCEELKIACAANFILPMKEISKNFEKEYQVKITPVFGSTGMLYSQIINSAPFDIFFAADTKRPELLVQNKTGKDFFLYAKGKSVLWTKFENLKILKNFEDVFKNSKSVSIALPDAAPYGKTVYELLEKKGLLKYKDKLVFGKNVSQSFQYAFSGFTDSGFCALSQALSEKGKTGFYLSLDEAEPVIQGGCILKAKKSAYNFVEYVKKSDNILKKYGYEKP